MQPEGAMTNIQEAASAESTEHPLHRPQLSCTTQHTAAD